MIIVIATSCFPWTCIRCRSMQCFRWERSVWFFFYILIPCVCVTGLPLWLLCWLLRCTPRTHRAWGDEGSLALAVHTDTRRCHSRKKQKKSRLFFFLSFSPTKPCFKDHLQDPHRPMHCDSKGLLDLSVPVLCTASVDTASSHGGDICDEVFIVYTGCCQLKCLKYLTIIIYY